jgi:Uma2 family endonuclease
VALPARREARGLTYADYLQWPEGERGELIEGVAYGMTPAPSTAHQRVLRELAFQIHAWLKGRTCQVFFAPFDVRLPAGDEDDPDVETVVQPDIVVVCDAHKVDERGCRGAPDFIIEVSSPSTAVRDQIEKADLYERHRVREYWIVQDRLVFVRILAPDGKYGHPVPVKGEGRLAVRALPGLVISFDEVFTEGPPGSS